MRNHRFGIAAAGVIATAALAAGVAAAPTSAGSATAVPFKASYAGTAVVKVDGNVADIIATGTGKGTLIGAGKITGAGKGDSSVQPCVPFTGTGALSAWARPSSRSRSSRAPAAAATRAARSSASAGKANVVTRLPGSSRRPSGTLKFTGVYDRGAGTFTVKFTGTLTK